MSEAAESVVERWVPALQGVEARLRDGALGADVGCGLGMGTIALARAYPSSHFFGFDTESFVVRRAERLAEQHGVLERTTFEAVAPESIPNHRYALIVLRYGLCRLAERVRAARRALTTLDSQGSLLIIEPGPHVEQLAFHGALRSALAEAGFRQVCLLELSELMGVFEARR